MAGNKAKSIAVAASLLAFPVTAQYEGLMLKDYLDPVGIRSECYGDTFDVKPNTTKTKPQCDAMLTMRLGYFALKIEASTKTVMTVPTLAALTSFTYNIGLDKFKKSTVFKRLDAGNIEGACRFLPKYIYAGKVILNGLVKRRDAEMELCLSGLVKA